MGENYCCSKKNIISNYHCPVFYRHYFIQNSLFDVGTCIAFGLFGWVLKRGGFPTAPIILGLILGNMIEENLRLSLVKGDLIDFVTRPGSLIILIMALLSFFLPYVKKHFNKSPQEA